MINDTDLCKVAKILHNINPEVIIDDPIKVEKLLRSWFESWLKSNDDCVIEMHEDLDNALNNWLRAYLKVRIK